MLRQQYEQTGNLLDILDNPAVLEEMIRIESECSEIGVGVPAYSKNPKPITPAQAKAMIRKVRLQSMVLSDFSELIRSVNLGAGTEAAITEGDGAFVSNWLILRKNSKHISMLWLTKISFSSQINRFVPN